MNVRRTRRLLWGAAGLLTLGGLGALTLSLSLPLEEPRRGMEPRAVSRTETGPTETGVSRARIEKLGSLRLRQRLFDPPPKPPLPEPKPVKKPLPPVKLMGTLTGSSPMALVAGKGGKVEFKRVGERIGDERNFAVIKEIADRAIKVEHEGEVVEILVEEAKR